MGLEEIASIKVCSICKEPKQISNFSGKGGKSRSSYCRKCKRKKKHDLGICIACCNQAVAGKLRCAKCNSNQNQYRKNLHLKLRLEAFENYGKYCAYCGEDFIEFLTIDHINNNGSEHRRSISNNHNNGGIVVYRWLKKNLYPEGFQTLCYNCNCAKSRIGNEQLILLLSNANRLISKNYSSLPSSCNR